VLYSQETCTGNAWNVQKQHSVTMPWQRHLTQIGSPHSNMGKLQLKTVDLQCPSMCHTDENTYKVPKIINKDHSRDCCQVRPLIQSMQSSCLCCSVKSKSSRNFWLLKMQLWFLTFLTHLILVNVISSCLKE